MRKKNGWKRSLQGLTQKMKQKIVGLRVTQLRKRLDQSIRSRKDLQKNLELSQELDRMMNLYQRLQQ